MPKYSKEVFHFCKDIVRSPVLLTSEEGQDLLQKIFFCLKKMCGHLILSPKTDGRTGYFI